MADAGDKYPTVLGVARDLAYDAIFPNSADLERCPDLPALAAERGLWVAPDAMLPGDAALRVKMCSVGGMRVALVHLAAAPISPVSPTDLARALAPVVDAASDACAIVIAVGRLGLSLDKDLLQQEDIAGRFDLLIEVAGGVSLPEPETINGCMVLLPPHSGTSIGEITIALEAGTPRIAHRVHPVTDNGPLHEGVRQAVMTFLRRRPRTEPQTPPRPPTQRGYASANRCVECHKPEALSWAESDHATAAETLRAEGRFTPECLACHSEYYRRTGQVADLPPGDDAVQCSACHGDGLLHSATGSKAHVLPGASERTCRTCHDAEHSPRFNYAEYLDSIRHSPP